MDPTMFIVFFMMYIRVNFILIEVSVPEMLRNFTEDSSDKSILGTLSITDFTVTGFDTIENQDYNIKATEDENGNIQSCMYYPVGYLKLDTNYVADIGIDNEIPIYGDGRISIAIKNLEINFCAYFDFTNSFVDQVTTKFSWRHSPIEFSGFLRNREATEILERILNIANRFFAMWSAYEPDRAGCLINPIIEYYLNEFTYIQKEDNSLSFENVESCLQELYTEDAIHLSDYENLKGYLLKFMETEEDVGSIRDFLDDNNTKHVISKLTSPVVDVIKRIFNNRG